MCGTTTETDTYRRYALQKRVIWIVCKVLHDHSMKLLFKELDILRTTNYSNYKLPIVYKRTMQGSESIYGMIYWLESHMSPVIPGLGQYRAPGPITVTWNWPSYSHRFKIIYRQKVLVQQMQVKMKFIICLSNTSIALVCISVLGYDGVPCTTSAYVLIGQH